MYKIYIGYEQLCSLIKLKEAIDTANYKEILRYNITMVELVHEQNGVIITKVVRYDFEYLEITIQSILNDKTISSCGLFYTIFGELFLRDIVTDVRHAGHYRVLPILYQLLDISNSPTHVCNHPHSTSYLKHRLAKNCTSCKAFLNCLSRGVDVVL